MNSLENLLFRDGHINEELKLLLSKLPSPKLRNIREHLLQNSLINEEVFFQCLSEYLNLKYVDLDSLKLDTKEIVLQFNEKYARSFLVIPIDIQEDKIVLATFEPENRFNLQTLKNIIHKDIEFVIASKSKINKNIEKVFFDADNLIEGIAQRLNKKVNLSTPKAKKTELSQTEKKTNIAHSLNIEHLIDEIINDALEKSASDIHIEPKTGQDTVIRMRISGTLFNAGSIPIELYPLLITRLKINSSLDISEKRVPQDGSFRFFSHSKTIDIRLSTLPSVAGEKIVMRILDKSALKVKLSDLGMTLNVENRVKNFIKKPYGILIVTGPTGSGKTTTIYSLLNQIDKKTKNVTTVEDPVEYAINEITQVQINTSAGLTFPAALKSILRQDPDVVMIGEIRDHETAEIAVRAALTGHLVISTLHTNNAIGAISRLIDMGIPSYLVASSVLGIIAQRLIRRICPSCQGKKDNCNKCKGSGFSGRLGIYEVLEISPKIKSLINDQAGENEIQKNALEEAKLVLMKEDGKEKILKGITTQEEVESVVDS